MTSFIIFGKFQPFKYCFCPILSLFFLRFQWTVLDVRLLTTCSCFLPCLHSEPFPLIYCFNCLLAFKPVQWILNFSFCIFQLQNYSLLLLKICFVTFYGFYFIAEILKFDFHLLEHSKHILKSVFDNLIFGVRVESVFVVCCFYSFWSCSHLVCLVVFNGMLGFAFEKLSEKSFETKDDIFQKGFFWWPLLEGIQYYLY